MSYTHNRGYSATESGFAVGVKGSEVQVLAGTGVSSAYFTIGAVSTTSGANPALSSSHTQTMFVGGDDVTAAIGPGVHIAAGRFRTVLLYTAGNREQEVSSVRGQLVSKNGVNRHNMSAVTGSYEVNTGLTVDGQVFATDPWIQAGVLGRVGAGSAITTINANGRLSALAAMSATQSFAANSGVYAGLYVGRWATAMDFGYGVYVENSDIGVYIKNSEIPSGDSYSGLRVYVDNGTTDTSNEYGLAAYFDSTLTANAGADNAGHVYNVGSWMNIGSGYTPVAGKIHVPFEGGIYDGGGTLTNARLVFGGQHQAVLSSSPASLHAWRLNTATYAVTALIAAASPQSVGYVAGAGTSGAQVGYVPIADIVGPGVVYVRVYSSAT